MFKLGPLTLKHPFILAPMAGVTDYPFRMLCRSFGCEMAFVEMINARSLGYKSKRTKSMLFSTKDDKPLGVQLLGCEPQYIRRALDILKEYPFDILDFNAACPAKKVVRRGEGAALMKDPRKLGTILKLVVKESTFPVTIKIRSGWDEHSVNCHEIARRAEDCGARAVFVHGRTKVQEYSGSVDYKAIARVKAAVKIPVIASGDIWNALLAKKMFDETGCDALAVARGAIGYPWIFSEIKAHLRDGTRLERPSAVAMAKVMEEHLRSNVSYWGERNGVVLYRKFFASYTKGWARVRPLREKASRVTTLKQMLALISACQTHLSNPRG
jgi:tRNA-dihydrouridine synthase B